MTACILCALGGFLVGIPTGWGVAVLVLLWSRFKRRG